MVRGGEEGKANCHQPIIACQAPEKLPVDSCAEDSPQPPAASWSAHLWEWFTAQHTWGEGRPSVCVRQLFFQRKPRWITYFQLMPWKEDQSCWNQKRNIKKKTKNNNFIAPTYIQGRKFYIKFLWFKGRSQTTDPNSSWSEVKARSAKKSATDITAHKNHISHSPNKTLHVFLNAEVSCFVDLSLWCFILMFKIAPLKNI